MTIYMAYLKGRWQQVSKPHWEKLLKRKGFSAERLATVEKLKKPRKMR